MYGARYSSQFLMKYEFSRQISEKFSHIKFNENPSIGSRVVPCGRTERGTDMTKLIVALPNFSISPKIDVKNSGFQILV